MHASRRKRTAVWPAFARLPVLVILFLFIQSTKISSCFYFSVDFSRSFSRLKCDVFMFSSFVIGSNVIRIHVGLYIAYSNIDNGDGNINDTDDADKNGINACQMDASVSDVSVKTKKYRSYLFTFCYRLSF